MFGQPENLYDNEAQRRARESQLAGLEVSERQRGYPFRGGPHNPGYPGDSVYKRSCREISNALLGYQPTLGDPLQRSCRCERTQSPFMQKILLDIAEYEKKKRIEQEKRQRLARKKRITVIQRNGVSIFIHTGFRKTH